MGPRRRRTGGLPGTGPAAIHPTATRPVPSPTLTLQQPLDDAVDVELVYIRHRLSAAGRTPPRGSPPSARCLAGPTSLLVLSRFSPSSSPPLSPSSLSLFPPRPPLDRRSQQRPSTEQNGRRLLSELSRRTDTYEREAAHRKPFIGRAGRAGRGNRLGAASARRILPLTEGEIVRRLPPFRVGVATGLALASVRRKPAVSWTSSPSGASRWREAVAGVGFLSVPAQRLRCLDP